MNANQIYKKMISVAQSLSVEALKAEIKKWMSDTSDDAGVMFNVLLTALENKMPEADYVAFCDAL